VALQYALPRLGAMKRNRSIPAAGVIPVLIYPDVREAVAWLEKVFGFAEALRIGEAHRAQLDYGDGAALIVADVRRAQVPPTPGVVPSLVLLRVEDVDAVCERARAAGATVVDEPHTWEYGERQATIDDVAGHRWTLSQTVEDVDPADWGGELLRPR
jgi:uncharacterized glyoxalase superfamily protein PhnB